MLQCEVENGVRRNPLYLPIARTGFLLTYKTLTGNAIQEKFTLNETKKNLLTKPSSDFLVKLNSIRAEKLNPKFAELIDFIERHIISGHVSISDLPLQDIMYVPDGAEDFIPMYISSAVVTEITPLLLLFLKYENISALLFEEPEISLHPKLQWEIARVLIQLANMDIPVFVTTHSDIILQHINNMIKAFDRKENSSFLENLKYKEKELLSKDRVAVYQFDVQKNEKTQVNRLLCGDYGFEAMTFYNTLKQLNDEIYQIESEE